MFAEGVNLIHAPVDTYENTVDDQPASKTDIS